MGKRGPKPKPTNLRLLTAARKDRINTREPKPAAGDVVAPRGLPALAREVWDRLAPDLIRHRVLTPWDVDAFSTLCSVIALNHGAIDHCFDLEGRPVVLVPGERGMVKNPALQAVRDLTAALLSLAARFGLTPSDRSQLSIAGEAPDAEGPDRLLST